MAKKSPDKLEKLNSSLFGRISFGREKSQYIVWLAIFLGDASVKTCLKKKKI